ncbi:MerR family transcriptional regulator [Ketogulonicigenium vulgare]|uniref:MerR family transcriptional regulator n=1 Tax=Ketogulonicigenium vulgare TaxID=92945 RepID=UPI0023589F31|nr:helix-turn-helix domain-containing protein [Ketogulonicigenium vulgare]
MLTIGKLGKAAGVKVPTIRYYEQIGLLPDVGRSAGNQRLYGNDVLNRLRFIRHARDLGFPLEDVRALLSLSDQPEHSCAAVDTIAVRQLAEVRDRISRLQALEAELARMIAQDAHTTIADCRVIEVLGNHDLCKHHDHAETAH